MRRIQSRKYQETVRRADRPEPTDLETSEVSQTIKESLSALPPEFRQPVVLHIMEGLPQTEVGRLMGISNEAVRQRVEKGLALLRRRLTQSGVTLSAAVLAETLRTQVLPAVPVTLKFALRKLALNPAAAAQNAGVVVASVRTTKAGLRLAALIVIGGAAVAATVAATVGLPRWTEAEPPAESTLLSPPLWSWNFDAGFPKNLKPLPSSGSWLSGSWEW
jgi:hypothetical protein